MTSDLKLLFSLKVQLEREVANGDWPNAQQGTDAIVYNLSGVDVTVWDGALIAKVAVAPATTVTLDLRAFTSLLFEATGLATVMLMAFRCDADDDANPDCDVIVSPGAADGFQGPWVTGDETAGIHLLDGELLVWGSKADEADGYATTAGEKNLDFENVGTDAGTVTVIILGGAL